MAKRQEPGLDLLLEPDPDPTPEPALDPFDFDRLRLPQNFHELVNVKRVITSLPVRRPHAHEFFRIRTGAGWELDTFVLMDKIERETFLVSQDLWAALSAELTPVKLVLGVNRQNSIFFWPLKLTPPDGRVSTWAQSALLVAERAQRDWVRMQADMAAGGYLMQVALGPLPEPEWPPDQSFKDLLQIAFRSYYIDSMDHVVLQRLRGEI